MITTLATGAMVEGLTYAITSCVVTTDGPDWLTDLSALNGHMGFIPFPPIIGIWAAYSVIALLLLHKTTWGKRLYAAGVNDDAAKLALVNTTWMHIGAFVFSSVSAVLAGILLAGFAGSAYFTVGQPYLFLTVGAVVVGGTMVIGGRGGYGRTIFGSLIITLISTITIGYGFDTALQQAFLGFIIVFLMGCYGRELHLGLRM